MIDDDSQGSQPEVTTFYRDCTYYVTPTVVIPFLLAAKLSRLISRYKPANLTEGTPNTFYKKHRYFANSPVSNFFQKFH